MPNPQPLPPDGAPRPNEDLPDPGPPRVPDLPVPDVEPGIPGTPDGDLITPGRVPGMTAVLP
ncbi:hypothetical protein [Arenibaculum pallidiluteum]|uniref:hypothetical protein n=1 Tax=Arenibaculum pallidiluteum TaxID=2812559 RepID=UPI001A9637E5|nr:hypothetical protein [Arenibaculum pallidiluteum]